MKTGNREQGRGTSGAALLALLFPVPFSLLSLLFEFPDRPPLAHSGGFGEPTCQACHDYNSLNDPAGSLRVSGLPVSYRPGERYRLSVQLTRAGMAKGGFQLTSRGAGGKALGRQAGKLFPLDDRVAVRETTVATHGVIQYASHTQAGSDTSAAQASTWTVLWSAPSAGTGDVVFHVAGNAANGDDSPLDDFIYIDSMVVQGTGKRER